MTEPQLPAKRGSVNVNRDEGPVGLADSRTFIGRGKAKFQSA